MENDSEEETGREGWKDFREGAGQSPAAVGKRVSGEEHRWAGPHVADFHHLIYNSKEVASSQVSKCQGNY